MRVIHLYFTKRTSTKKSLIGVRYCKIHSFSNSVNYLNLNSGHIKYSGLAN